MGDSAQITADDGFTLGAYQAQPEAAPKGAVVVIQEIFGVNSHIREVVDGYAAAGYFAIAPQIFDRVERGIELGYEEADMGTGVEIAFQKLDHAAALKDVQAAIDVASVHGKVGVVGYCFGGLLTWLAACELSGVSAAASYYGGGVAGEANGGRHGRFSHSYSAPDDDLPGCQRQPGHRLQGAHASRETQKQPQDCQLAQHVYSFCTPSLSIGRLGYPG